MGEAGSRKLRTRVWQFTQNEMYAFYRRRWSLVQNEIYAPAAKGVGRLRRTKFTRKSIVAAEGGDDLRGLIYTLAAEGGGRLHTKFTHFLK